MPITRSVITQYKKQHFVETGTFKGAALRLAQDIGFDSYWSCDINQGYVDAAKGEGFANVFCSSSPEFLAKVLPDIIGDITFWLDAHTCTKPMDITADNVPLLKELMAIKGFAHTGSHVIMIDDLRAVTHGHQRLLKTEIARLWPTAGCIYHDDYLSKDDILVIVLRPKRKTVVQIGANAGNDGLTKMLEHEHPDKLILVEPVKMHHAALQECYYDFDKVVIEGCAIVPEMQEKPTVEIWMHRADDGKGHNAPFRSASLEKSHQSRHAWVTDKLGYISDDVPWMTIHQLCDKHSIKKIDLLWIDAEGLDEKIIRSIDFDKVEISDIYFERAFLDSKADIYLYLQKKGYNIEEWTGADHMQSRAWK
jgi:FkbM family methyltransferase